MKGLEPPRREAPDPKSGAATNYATSAFLGLFGLQNYAFLSDYKMKKGNILLRMINTFGGAQHLGFIQGHFFGVLFHK